MKLLGMNAIWNIQVRFQDSHHIPSTEMLLKLARDVPICAGKMLSMSDVEIKLRDKTADPVTILRFEPGEAIMIPKRFKYLTERLVQ
jgi:hypothetical protein